MTIKTVVNTFIKAQRVKCRPRGINAPMPNTYAGKLTKRALREIGYVCHDCGKKYGRYGDVITDIGPYLTRPCDICGGDEYTAVQPVRNYGYLKREPNEDT